MNSQPFESPSVAAIPYTPSSRRSIYKADQSNYTKSAETSNPRSSCNGNADLANQNTYYGYLPPPNRKSPKLPHKDITLKGLEVEDAMPELEHEAAVSNCRRMTVEIMKNPGLGFSVAGGIGLQGNPYRPLDEGIFVTKIIQNGPASKLLVPGDKIIKVNDTSFAHMEHSEAVNILKNSPPKVTLCIERLIPTDL